MDFQTGRGGGLDQAHHEIGRGIATVLAVEAECAARAVLGGARRLQLPQFQAGHDGVRSTVPAHLVRNHPCRIVLEPVGAAVAPSGETGDVELGDAGVVERNVAVEAGDAQILARVGQALHVEIVQRVALEPLFAKAEVVDQVRGNCLRVSGTVVPGHQRARAGAGRNGRTGEDVALLHLEPEIDPGRAADVLVHTVHTLVRVVVVGSAVAEVVGDSAKVGRGVVGLEFRRNRGQARRRNLVAGKGCARSEGVLHDSGRLREIAGKHLGGHHAGETGTLPDLPQTFIRTHEERLVLAVVELGNVDGAVDFDPELVLPQRCFLRRRAQEERARIELVVADKFHQTAMQIIGAGFRHHVDMDSHVGAVLRAIGAGLDLHFLHRVHRRARRRRGDQVVDNADAVERNAVGDFASTGTDEVLPGGHAVGGLEARQGTGSDRGQFQGVAPVERQFRHVADADCFRNAGVVGLDGGGRTFDVDGLRHVANLQDHIVADNLVQVNMDVLHRSRLETGLLHRNRVVADADELDVVVALIVRRGGIGVACAVLDGGDGRALHDRRCRIGDGAHQRGGGGNLREG